MDDASSHGSNETPPSSTEESRNDPDPEVDIINVELGEDEQAIQEIQESWDKVMRIRDDLSADNEELKLYPKWLQIGEYRATAVDHSLVARFKFRKQLITWELEEAIERVRIEIPLHIILSSRVVMEGNHGELEIELGSVPKFSFKGVNGWEVYVDFTDHQASIHRRHVLHFEDGDLQEMFGSGVLELQLSESPFPTLESERFDPISDSDAALSDAHIPIQSSGTSSDPSRTSLETTEQENSEPSNDNDQNEHENSEPSNDNDQNEHENSEPSNDNDQNEHENSEPSNDNDQNEHENSEPSNDNGQNEHENSEPSNDNDQNEHENSEPSNDNGQNEHENSETDEDDEDTSSSDSSDDEDPPSSDSSDEDPPSSDSSDGADQSSNANQSTTSTASSNRPNEDPSSDDSVGQPNEAPPDSSQGSNTG